ncbi:MAG: SDR family oxidoreductase [Burkholderiales bacterium]|nr:SDR family oxidoreductase [Burkholderiales bacterium]
MPQKHQDPKAVRPPQEQAEPGSEAQMKPRPRIIRDNYQGSAKLKDKVALITGGDSGIGRGVAVHFAREGADVAIMHLSEEREDANETRLLVEQEGRRCLTMVGDIGDEQTAQRAVEQTMRQLGRLDILINNAAEQHPQKSIEDLSAAQLERTFRTNVFGMFFMTKAAMPHLKKGSAIINTTSVTAYRGSANLLDYAATKGAIVAFTRSLAHAVIEQGIRVNAVAPGPVWTPLISSTFPAEKVATFGTDSPMGRAGEPEDIAPCYVFLACADSLYITGQVLHPNGGEIVNG